MKESVIKGINYTIRISPNFSKIPYYLNNIKYFQKAGATAFLKEKKIFRDQNKMWSHSAFSYFNPNSEGHMMYEELIVIFTRISAMS